MSETKRKIFIIIVLLLVILFGVGQFFVGSINPTAQNQGQNANQVSATQVLAIGQPFLVSSSTPVENGSCFATSIAAPYRTDAWRCAVGNAISDPCFDLSQASGTVGVQDLACGGNPADVTAASTFVLHLIKPLPKVTAPSGNIPANWAWFVELSDGTFCTPFTGTRPFAATHEVATYSCSGGPNGEDMIFGDLNNASTTWIAEVGSLSTETSTFPPAIVASATVPISAVWQ